MSELEAFELKVRENIKLLNSPDPKIRRKAAQWLGEAGDPSAITRLRQVYKEDDDKRVQQAAEYSLGMFKALEQGLAGKDQEKVLQRLEDIALRDRMGRRSPIRGRTVARINLGLVVSLALLLIFNFLVWPQLEPRLSELGAQSTPVAEVNEPALDRSALLNQLGEQHRLVRTDAETLQRIYQTVLGGSAPDCSAFFNNPMAVDPTSARNEADLQTIASSLNDALESLNAAKTAYDQACPPNNTPLTAAEVGAPLGTLLTAIRSLPEIETALAAAHGETAEPTQTAAQDVTPSDSATSSPPAVVDFRSHLAGLYTLIDEMEGADGANAVLNQRWSNIRSTGGSAVCQQASPTLPADYVLPEADAQASANLRLAIDLVNQGLALVRQGWNQLETACRNNTLDVAINAGLQSSQSASIAFESAETLLNDLRDGG